MPSKRNKSKDQDYEPIRPVKKNPDKALKKLEEYNDDDSPPDDLTSVLIKFLKKFNGVTGLFIFMIYILFSTDCFQLHIVRELYPAAYDAKIDTITDSGIVLNGGLISLFYMVFDVCYNQN